MPHSARSPSLPRVPVRSSFGARFGKINIEGALCPHKRWRRTARLRVEGRVPGARPPWARRRRKGRLRRQLLDLPGRGPAPRRRGWVCILAAHWSSGGWAGIRRRPTSPSSNRKCLSVFPAGCHFTRLGPEEKDSAAAAGPGHRDAAAAAAATAGRKRRKKERKRRARRSPQRRQLGLRDRGKAAAATGTAQQP